MNRLAATLLAALAGATSAPAATLVATPTDLNASFTGFQIAYTDKNGNALIEFDEITSFSGVTQTVNTTYPLQQTFLSGLPAIDKISIAGAAPWVTPDANDWIFSGANASDPQVGGSADFWTYRLAPGPVTPAPVPLPASVWLLAGSAAALAATVRRRRAPTT